MNDLYGKTVVVTGATRGIGQAIALKMAEHGANLVILSKDTDENIQKTIGLFKNFNGDSLILNIDITDIKKLEESIQTVVDNFSGIDILVNNTSAACFEDILHLLPDQFDLMIATSVRAAFFLTQFSVPSLRFAQNPHIINISPPLNMDSNWFKDYLGFSISKYAMSMCTLGMAEKFKEEKIAINSLWPKSTIATQTIKDHFSSKIYSASRKPSIMADAAYKLSLRQSSKCTGQFFIDEELLQEEGISDFSQYAVNPKATLMQALFIPEDEEMSPVPKDSFL